MGLADDPTTLERGAYDDINYLAGGYADAAERQMDMIQGGCGDWMALIGDTMMSGWNLLGWADGIGEGRSLISCLLNGGCFVAGTPVQMAKGTTPIERVKSGDKIRSRIGTNA